MVILYFRLVLSYLQRVVKHRVHTFWCALEIESLHTYWRQNFVDLIIDWKRLKKIEMLF